jgi:hypothetical protein
MNNKKKVVAGVSGAGLVVWIFRLLHFINPGSSVVNPDSVFDKTEADIILTDSTGKKYTMPLQDYPQGIKNK